MPVLNMDMLLADVTESQILGKITVAVWLNTGKDGKRRLKASGSETVK